MVGTSIRLYRIPEAGGLRDAGVASSGRAAP